MGPASLGRLRLYRDIPEELRALIEPVVADHDCELVNVEVRAGQGPGVVRITVDSAVNDGRVPVERCAALSREIESQLDASDAIPGRYRLEVSSPGLDRMLAREKDFATAIGQQVKLQTRRPLDGRRRFRGVLVAFEQGVARLRLADGAAGDGKQEVDIPFEEVSKANVVYEFSRTDFEASSS